MNTPAGYQQYEKNKILTASPAELTLMLYEGAIKFANIAIMAIEKGEIEKAHNNIRKVERIIEEFQATLNHKYPVAKDFDEVYTYLKRRLLEANIKKDKDIMEEVLRHLRTMRDTWKDVMRLSKSQGQQ
ncbi:MAG: flagellar export chaperone FliS [Lachnospiraceae bacterium]